MIKPLKTKYGRGPNELKKRVKENLGPNRIWFVDLHSKEDALAFKIQNFNMIRKDAVETWLEENIGTEVADHVLQSMDRTDIWTHYSRTGNNVIGIVERYHFNHPDNAQKFWDEFNSSGVKIKVSRDTARGEWTEVAKDLPFDIMEWSLILHQAEGYEIVVRDPKIAMLIKLKWASID